MLTGAGWTQSTFRITLTMRTVMVRQLMKSRRYGYLFAVLGIALVTAALAPIHSRLSSTTVALIFLLVVLFTATGWGSRPAFLASAIGGLSFNFFFLPPVHTFTIAELENWVALAVFFITALTVGQLSARVKQRAEEAEAGRTQIKHLYDELQTAFERASHAEALKQSEQLKSALLDAVTHDLRTPLTSIKASVTTLLDSTTHKPAPALDDDGQKELLEVIDEETDRLNHFIEGMVELARIEAGEVQLRRNWVAIDDILHTALQRAESLTRAHPLHIEIKKDLPAIRVDARSIAEVVYTLIDNAAKYSPAGAPIRILAQHPVDLIASEMIRIVVEDEGQGIPVELRERVFDKFFRAAGETVISKTRASSIGMGLAIARGIVEAHGGHIWIESARTGHGTRVTFTLPVGDTENE